VLHVPNFAKKIVSLTLLNDKGNDVKLTENGMEISKGDNKMIIPKKSALYYLEVMSTIGGDNENQENLEETGKECIFINTAGLYHPTLQGSKYWVKIVCDTTGCSFDYFIGKKSEVLGILKGFISKVKAKGHEVKFVCCNNAGEHQSTFKLVCDAARVTKEFTAPHSPQMNGPVERQFATDGGKALASMIQACLTDVAQQLLWAEACSAASENTNIMCNTKNKQKSPLELWTGVKPKIYAHLIEWGRVGYIADRQKIMKQFQPKAAPCIFVGYAQDHSGDVYRMYNPITQKIILSCDITWDDWKRSDPKDGMAEFGSISKPGMDARLTMPNDDNKLDNTNETPNVDSNHAPDEVAEIPAPDTGRMESDASDAPEAVAIKRPKTKRLERELKRLESPFLNPMSGMESVTVVNNTGNTDGTETTKEKEI
jgi:hypothetical protein